MPPKCVPFPTKGIPRPYVILPSASIGHTEIVQKIDFDPPQIFRENVPEEVRTANDTEPFVKNINDQNSKEQELLVQRNLRELSLRKTPKTDV